MTREPGHTAMWFVGFVQGLLTTLALVAILAQCTACAHVEVAPDDSACEREAALRGAECATVYAFAEPADNPLGHVELCVPERYLADAERAHGPSWPSDDERFTQYTRGLVDPPCFWACPPTGPGCNAFDSCFCEVTP